MHSVILLLLGSITTDWVWLLIFTRFLDHTQRRTTVGRTPLNEWSVRRLTTHNNHNRQTSMPPDVLRIFYLSLKIRRLRPGLNPRTWVPKASTLPLDHRSRKLLQLNVKAKSRERKMLQAMGISHTMKHKWYETHYYNKMECNWWWNKWFYKIISYSASCSRVKIRPYSI